MTFVSKVKVTNTLNVVSRLVTRSEPHLLRVFMFRTMIAYGV